MIKRYHNKAAIQIERRIFDKLRGYIGDGRHRRRKAFAMALLLDNGGKYEQQAWDYFFVDNQCQKGD